MEPARPNPLARRMQNHVALAAEDLVALDRLLGGEERIEADRDIVVEGRAPRAPFVLVQGIACRYRLFADGRRQIIAFLLPGDLCDLHGSMRRRMDHSIGTLTAVRLCTVSRDDVLDTTLHHPRIGAGLCWCAGQEAAILRERIVALGRRNATERVAFLLCELVWRFRTIGEGRDDTIDLPLTQIEIADTLGLTPVHVNRVIQDLRRRVLVRLEYRRLSVIDMRALEALAEFDPAYLDLEAAREEARMHVADAGGVSGD